MTQDVVSRSKRSRGLKPKTDNAQIPARNPVRGELVGSATAGKLLGVSPKTLTALARKNRLYISFYIVSGNYKFDTADIADYLSTMKITPQGGPPMF
jgi:hypothetical protein